MDWTALVLSLELAALTTLILLPLASPLAWWLAHSGSRWTAPVQALVGLPLVLPPTVLGFYLLLAFSPQGWLGGLSLAWFGAPLAFSFWGLLIGSLLFSAPFVVQPLTTAFAGVTRGQLEAAATLGAGPLDRFFSISMPLAARGYLAAATLGFTHTLGEFGLVLMVGGNIPGETRVLSIALYDRVEALDYAGAHRMAAVLVVISFIALLLLYGVSAKQPGARRF